MGAHGLDVCLLPEGARKNRLVSPPHVHDVPEEALQLCLRILLKKSTSLLYQARLHWHSVANELVQLRQDRSSETCLAWVIRCNHQLPATLKHLDPELLPQNQQIPAKLPGQLPEAFRVVQSQDHIRGPYGGLRCQNPPLPTLC